MFGNNRPICLLHTLVEQANHTSRCGFSLTLQLNIQHGRGTQEIAPSTILQT